MANRGPHATNRTCDLLRRYGSEVTDRPPYSVQTSRPVIFICFHPFGSTWLASHREARWRLPARHLTPVFFYDEMQGLVPRWDNAEMSVVIRGCLVCTICCSEVRCIHRVRTKFSASEGCHVFSHFFVLSVVLIFGGVVILKSYISIPTFQKSFCISSRML